MTGPEETWKPIQDALGYEASSSGRIRGPRGILQPSPMKNGYLGIKIKGKGTTVHAAVATAFHGPRPSDRHTVNHKSGIKSDNTPGNLEWVTHLENMRHAVDTLGIKFGGKPRLPPAPQMPPAGTLHQSIVVLDSDGSVMRRIDLYVPTSGRCDQHAAIIDGERVGLLSATQIARRLRGTIRSRPSVSLLADARRDLYATERDELDAAAC